MGKRVLLLEDERKTADVIVRVTKALKLGIDWVHCMTNAEAEAVEEEPDAMLIDLMLAGGECGLDFLRTARLRNWWCPARIFRGWHEDFELSSQASALAADVLPKPLPMDDLFEWLMAGEPHHQRAVVLVRPLLAPAAPTPAPSERFVGMLGAKPLAKGEFRAQVNGYERDIIAGTCRVAGSKHAAADRLGLDRSYVQKKLRGKR